MGSTNPSVTIADAFTTGRGSDAGQLVFEYMAATQSEAGRGDVDEIGQLPSILSSECIDPRAAYPPPGTVFLALHGEEPVGAVGIKLLLLGRAEIKRLWVRPPARGVGVGRLLMAAAHRHARNSGISELFLDVMPSRPHVVDFYRRLGYVETEPFTEEIIPMIYLRREVK